MRGFRGVQGGLWGSGGFGGLGGLRGVDGGVGGLRGFRGVGGALSPQNALGVEEPSLGAEGQKGRGAAGRVPGPSIADASAVSDFHIM